MRLSKLQKWILTNCYMKTILKDDSNIKIHKAWTGYHQNKKYQKDDFYYKYLFRTEIYLNYFADINYTKIQNKYSVTCTRSINNLESKELITVYCGQCCNWIGIILTMEGIKVVNKLLNVN